MPDPEAHLFKSMREWVLVTQGASLANGAHWTDETIAFVCVEAIRERPHITVWERHARQVFFVRRADVAELGLVEGPIIGSDRYRLRDLAANPEIDAAGYLVTVP